MRENTFQSKTGNAPSITVESHRQTGNYFVNIKFDNVTFVDASDLKVQSNSV